jgi:hypothetical protein
MDYLRKCLSVNENVINRLTPSVDMHPVSTLLITLLSFVKQDVPAMLVNTYGLNGLQIAFFVFTEDGCKFSP